MPTELINALPNFSQRSRFYKFVQTAPDGILGMDCETTAITDTSMFDPDAAMRLIQFGSKDEAWVLDPHDKDWREVICATLNDPKLRFVSHSPYDVLWCRREFGIVIGRRGIDTIVLANLLHPGPFNAHDLKSLSERHIDSQLVEAEKALHARFKELAPVGHRVGTQPGSKLMVWGFNNIPTDDPAYTHYAGLDAIYVRRLLDILGDQVHPGMRKLARREQRIAQLAIEMQWRGMRVDRDYTKALLAEIEEGWQSADDELRELFGYSPRSPRRAEWFEDHNVEFVETTPTGRPSITKDTIPLALTRYQDDPVIAPVLTKMQTLSENANIKSNLSILLENADADGFVHPAINTCQAVTGRMSITKPAMQTFKKDDKRLRGCFIARDGHVFVGADYDSQEIRLAVAFSRDRALTRVVNEGLNQHDLTATMIFGDGWEEKQRHAAKTLNFAQQYGAGPKKIGKQLGISYSRARSLWEAWRHAYAGLVKWSEQMAQLPVVVNPWGRRIPRDRARPYASGNYMIQSSGRDLLGDAIIALDDAGWPDYIFMLVHDEIILEVPEYMADVAVEALEAAMYAEVRGVKMTATAKIIGKRWSGEPL
jgi:DNA polymerase I